MLDVLAHWDPIDGEVQASTPETSQVKTSRFDGLVRAMMGPVLLAMMVGFGVGVFSETWRFYGLGVFCMGFVVIFGGEALTGGKTNRDARVRNAIAANGLKGGTKIAETKVGALARRIRSLMILRIGGSIPLVVEQELWGQTDAGIPFWMGISVNESTVYGGGPKANVKWEGSGTQGEMAMFIVAYRLDRDTRLRVEIMPEFATAIGPLDRDIKTESAEFNAKYNIRMTLDEGKKTDPRKVTAGLLQVLTPATQAVLIGLADTYAARVIIDGDTVFFGGYRNFQTTDNDALTALIGQAITDFADAATAFKTYAE